jgi:ribosomal protein L37AE/L43A
VATLPRRREAGGVEFNAFEGGVNIMSIQTLREISAAAKEQEVGANNSYQIKVCEVEAALAEIEEAGKKLRYHEKEFLRILDERAAAIKRAERAETARDNCAKTAIELLGSSFCDTHGEKVKQLSFSAFAEWVKEMACLPCAIARLATVLAKQDKFGVHLQHCNFGEHAGSCKYGDEDCPALSESWSWFGERLQQIQRCEDCGIIMNPIGKGIFECWKCVWKNTGRKVKNANDRVEQRELDIDQICEALGCNDVAEARRSPIALAQQVSAGLVAAEANVAVLEGVIDNDRKLWDEIERQLKAREATLKLALDEAETIANVVKMFLGDAHDRSQNCRLYGAYGDGSLGCHACIALDELSKINAERLVAEYSCRRSE